MPSSLQTRSKLMATTAIVLLVFALAWFSSFFGDVWLLLTGEEYEIPAESNVFTFEATVMNAGSGDWWLYGEDANNYYHYTGQPRHPYIVYAKERAMSCRGFDPHDSSTWCQ